MRSPRFRSSGIAIVLVVGSLIAPAAARAAATYTVTRMDDPAPNGCATSDCSLREAVIAANGNPGSTVSVPVGTFTLTRTGADTSSANAAVGDLDILVAMTVIGAGDASTTVQAGTAKGGGIHRIFDVLSPNPVSISAMRIRFGTDTEARTGGCIKSTSVLTLSAVVVTSCTSSTGGGGISSYRSLTVSDSVITDNTTSSTSRIVNGGGVSGGPQASGAPGTVTITRTQITNNVATSTRPHIAYGGGFANTSIMNISDSTISGNSADSSAGGISGRSTTTTIERSTIAQNKAKRDGGGVTNDGVMTVIRTTFSDNQAGHQCSGADCNQAYAGGLLNTATGTANVLNSTFSGNSCLVSGGGLVNSRNNQSGQSGTLRLYNSTVVGNSCNLGAGVSSNPSGLTYLKNTLLADNVAGAGGGDCSGVVTSQGYNIIRTPTGCSIVGTTTGNITNTVPKVGSLQNNGGSTFTRGLLLGSPAINAGDPAGCTDTAGNPLSNDQRGFIRPSLGRCDIGAYELGTSVFLWTSANSAAAWEFNGPSIVSARNYGGPGPAWTAQSYWREPDGSYRILWSMDNAAQVWRYRSNHVLVGTSPHSGPGAGWTATSLFVLGDGGYELLWTSDNKGQVWTIKPDGGRGSTLEKVGPGAGFRATSYYRASDGSRRLLWSRTNSMNAWTLSPEGGFRTSHSASGPSGGDWTATSYNLNDDGSFDVLWATSDARGRLWTINANGTFRTSVSMTGPAGWTAQSYFFK